MLHLPLVSRRKGCATEDSSRRKVFSLVSNESGEVAPYMPLDRYKPGVANRVGLTRVATPTVSLVSPGAYQQNRADEKRKGRRESEWAGVVPRVGDLIVGSN
jgi:hypothetical protein